MQNSASVLEIKHKLSGERLEFECTSLVQEPGEVIVLYRTPRDFHIADQVFRKGSLSLGYFWQDRNFNIYHWLSPEGNSMAIYVNIADNTVITPGKVEWRDLIIDLLITPDGRCQILDEDELPDDLPSDLDQLIRAETKHLLERHQSLLAEIEQRSALLLDNCAIDC